MTVSGELAPGYSHIAPQSFTLRLSEFFLSPPTDTDCRASLGPDTDPVQMETCKNVNYEYFALLHKTGAELQLFLLHCFIRWVGSKNEALAILYAK